MIFKKIFLFCLCLGFPTWGWAWGTGHDDVARLLGEFLPTKIKEFLTEENFGLLEKYCHYPDNPNKTLEVTGEIVGEEDEAILRKWGYTGSDWLHRHRGRAVTYALLRKAFRERNAKNAAFYLSVLSHSVSDQGAINHTPILQFTTYSKFDGVSYGRKNSCELRLTEALGRKIRPQFQAYSPRLLAETFSESVFALVLDCYTQAEIAAEVETDIAFGTPLQAEEGMAKIACVQLKSLLDAAYSAWQFASAEEEITEEMLAEIGRREETRRRQGKPQTQAVYRGLFDASRNPQNPKTTVGLVCEPFGSFHVTSLSYVGKMLVAATGRTLRDHGYAIHPVSLWEMERTELPDPKEMPVLVIFAGSCSISNEIADTIRRYTESGGKLFYVAGKDPKNLVGMADGLTPRADGEVPVSTKWGIQNEDVYAAMKITFSPKLARLGTKEYTFRRNPNFDGFCKPICRYQIREAANIEPLAWLNNGSETFCVSARNAKGVWVPEYLLLPFLFSDATTLLWNDLRLDSFGETVLLAMLEELELGF
ncbi:MAG: hypothetical protein Q4D98_11475 [Planctomycetia bacterium]|nr:hypothetical protein [Planctomycetia bacterium]